MMVSTKDRLLTFEWAGRPSVEVSVRLEGEADMAQKWLSQLWTDLRLKGLDWSDWGVDVEQTSAVVSGELLGRFRSDVVTWTGEFEGWEQAALAFGHLALVAGAGSPDSEPWLSVKVSVPG